MNQVKTLFKYTMALAALVALSLMTAVYFMLNDTSATDASMFSAMVTGLVMFIIGRLFNRSK